MLPLENLSEEKENAYFADGIQDELLSNLAKIKDLKVISRTSVMQYKSGITRNLKEIAQQLGVSKVVEGSVRRSGNHIRVSVQLIDALTDRHIWAENYDRTLADSLALQGELATEIAASCGRDAESAGEGARGRPSPRTIPLLTMPICVPAQVCRRLAPGGCDSIISRGSEVGSEFCPGLGISLLCAEPELLVGTDPSPARLAAAKDSLDRALALDPNLPETHLALGYYRYHGQRDFTGALAEFQQAEQGLPNNADIIRAIAAYPTAAWAFGRGDRGARRAVELDPRNVDAAKNLATTYRMLRRFPEALAMVDRILALEPTKGSAPLSKSRGLSGDRGTFRQQNPTARKSGARSVLRCQSVLCSSAITMRP